MDTCCHWHMIHPEDPGACGRIEDYVPVEVELLDPPEDAHLPVTLELLLRVRHAGLLPFQQLAALGSALALLARQIGITEAALVYLVREYSRSLPVTPREIPLAMVPAGRAGQIPAMTPNP